MVKITKETPAKCPYGFTSADKIYNPKTWIKIIKAIFVKIK